MGITAKLMSGSKKPGPKSLMLIAGALAIGFVPVVDDEQVARVCDRWVPRSGSRRPTNLSHSALLGIAQRRIISHDLRGCTDEREEGLTDLPAAPELRDEVKLAAEEEGRSISDTARRVLISWAVARVIDRAGRDGARPHAA